MKISNPDVVRELALTYAKRKNDNPLATPDDYARDYIAAYQAIARYDGSAPDYTADESSAE